jgi:DNA-binding transcriptional LysR family regulator
MGVWPGLAERPEVAHTARDWLAKLRLVAAGCGLTTVPPSLVPAVPPGVRVVSVRGGPEELRRILVAWLPGRLSEPAGRLVDALAAVSRA